MDWTAIYETNGEEPFVIPSYLLHPVDRLSRLVLSYTYPITQKDDTGGEFSLNRPTNYYTPFACYLITLNYILGVGILGMPFAFAQSGIIMAMAMITVLSLCSYVSVLWVAEAVDRTLIIRNHEAQNVNRKNGISTEQRPLLPRHLGGSGSDLYNSCSPDSNYSEQIVANYASNNIHENTSKAEKELGLSSDSQRPVEVIDLVKLFLGSRHTLLYQASLMCLMYVGLLAYAQVFESSLQSLLPSVKPQSTAWLSVLFGILVVPLSCMDLDEQFFVQAICAFVRFLSIGLMVMGSVVGILFDFKDSQQFSEGIAHNFSTLHGDTGALPSPPYFAPPIKDMMSYTSDMNGFAIMFSTAVFSQLFQHSVPGLIRPLSDKKKVKTIFGSAIFTTFSMYLILGSAAAAYFGSQTKQSINLNFANFKYGLNEETSSPILLILCKISSSIILFFPALDTISVFPLIASTLGSNLFASKVGAVDLILKFMIPESPCCGNNEIKLSKKRRGERATKIAIIFWRLVASIPPIIGSIWVKDLSLSFLFSGISGIYIAFFIPALLQRSSTIELEKKNCTISDTVYSGWHSNSIFPQGILMFAAVSLCIMLLQLSSKLSA